MKLSPHFSLHEFEFSETATRKQIDNSVPAEFVGNLERVCDVILEPVRKRFGPVRITSGYRCPELNRAIGSGPKSAHQYGLAADFIVPGVTPLEVANWIRDNVTGYQQLIHEYGRWVHVSVPAEGHAARNQALTISHAGRQDGLHKVA